MNHIAQIELLLGGLIALVVIVGALIVLFFSKAWFPFAGGLSRHPKIAATGIVVGLILLAYSLEACIFAWIITFGVLIGLHLRDAGAPDKPIHFTSATPGFCLPKKRKKV